MVDVDEEAGMEVGRRGVRLRSRRVEEEADELDRSQTMGKLAWLHTVYPKGRGGSPLTPYQPFLANPPPLLTRRPHARLLVDLLKVNSPFKLARQSPPHQPSPACLLVNYAHARSSTSSASSTLSWLHRLSCHKLYLAQANPMMRLFLLSFLLPRML